MIYIADLGPGTHSALHPTYDDRYCVRVYLESGGVIAIRGFPFRLKKAERALLRHADPTDGRSKNISLDPEHTVLKGASLDPKEAGMAQDMLERFSAFARAVVLAYCPEYAKGMETRRTSWRPVEIQGREPASWRQDDTRLHVDAFPSQPTQGKRLLRVFANIHPRKLDRVWRVGEPFNDVCKRFLPRVSAYSPWWATLLHWCGLTQSLRSHYDHIMLGLHDEMKADMEYQSSVAATELRLSPGTVWMTFTDQCSHAALSGAQALEQTFEVDPSVLKYPEDSPEEILKKLGALPTSS